MARPKKIGLDYFPHDVDTFSDPKIEYIEALHGIIGYGVYFKLLEKVYRNGYFLPWSERDTRIFASKLSLESSKCDEIIKDLIKENLFDEEKFNTHSVLTSRGIQERYFFGVKKRSNVKVCEDLSLLPAVRQIIEPETEVFTAKTQQKDAETGQRKLNIKKQKTDENINKKEKELVELLVNHRKKLSENLAEVDATTYSDWVSEFHYIKEKLSADYSVVQQALKKAFSDRFWSKKILQPSDVLKHWEKILVLEEKCDGYSLDELEL